VKILPHNNPISALKDSPMFQLSLSAKELFHSNFLAWLCRLYPEEVLPVFTRYATNPLTNITDVQVLREKNHQDVKFVFPDGHTIVLENKVKSLPTKEQLRGYSNKYPNKKNCTFILLSLVKPDFAGTAWRFMDYHSLGNELLQVHPKIAKRNSYHGAILYDYAKSVLDMDRIVKSFFQKNDDFFGFKERLEKLSDLRFHDVIQKLIYSQLARTLESRLKNAGFQFVPVSEMDSAACGSLCVESSYTHGTGSATVFYVLNRVAKIRRAPVLFVQLQDNMLRLFFKYNKVRSVAVVAGKLRDSNLWFMFDRVPSKQRIKPKREPPEFNAFKTAGKKINLYRSIRIRVLSKTRLVDLFLQYMKHVRKHEEQIQHLISNVETSPKANRF
jgi:hypothetical protein